MPWCCWRASGSCLGAMTQRYGRLLNPTLASRTSSTPIAHYCLRYLLSSHFSIPSFLPVSTRCANPWMSCRDNAQKEKPFYSDALKFESAANFMNTIGAKNIEICGNRDSNSEPKQATYEAWEAWILPLNHCRGEDYLMYKCYRLYSHWE